MIGAIILAAGESTRMGTLKQILPWGDKTVIEASVDAACDSPVVNQVVAVLGHEADRIRAVLDKKIRPKLCLTLNPDYKLGMFSSVKAGIGVLDPRVEAFFIAPADQPEIQPEVYDKIIGIFRGLEQSEDIVIPQYQGRGGHPTLFRAALCSEIMSMPYHGNGLRDVIRKHEDRVTRVNIEHSGIIHDLDTREDYNQAIHRRGKT
jgi:molybdenum cofactor cytidylyltransferase